jgi:hypothetical protein
MTIVHKKDLKFSNENISRDSFICIANIFTLLMTYPAYFIPYYLKVRVMNNELLQEYANGGLKLIDVCVFKMS